jgi:hypothetical protein
MEPLSPSIAALVDSLTWPNPNADGTTTLDADTLRRTQALLNALVNYIQTQLARCKAE